MGAAVDPVPALDLKDPSLYVNREVSWLGFNRRVLEEAMDPTVPALERLKFLAIVDSNLAEFFEVRVARLQEQALAGVAPPIPDHLSPQEQLRVIGRMARALVADQYRCWNEQVKPALEAAGIRIVAMSGLDDVGRAFAEHHFEREVGPVLTPFTLDPAHPMPHIVSQALCLGVLLEDSGPQKTRRLGIVPLPRVLPRIVRLPGARHDYVTLGDLAAAFVGRLYPDRKILEAATFRVTRNANLEVDEEAVRDLLQAIEDELRHRRAGDVVRLEVSSKAGDDLTERLLRAFGLGHDDLYVVDGPVNMSRLLAIHGEVADARLKDAPLRPAVLPLPSEPEPLFARIRAGDVLLHHPYESFGHVVDFVEAAARDDRVLAIKQTLYRTSADSPIAQALVRAAESGKQVVVVVEIKARFDEAANIRWARRLEASGVHVVYGLVGLKTHAKLTLVVRREPDGVRRYAHLGTGNYNAATARVYTDLGLLTSREAMTADVARVFDFLTSLSRPAKMERLLVAPFDALDRIVGLIRREADHARAGRPARVVAKMNALADPDVIAALYEASIAGVSIDLLVRGICCLRPGVPGVSERIRVISVVDRFLEHSRVFWFENGGAPEAFVGSADWMPRNLRHRVEVLFPVEDPAILERIRSEILATYFADRVKARRILPDGTHERLLPAPGEAAVRAQAVLLESARQNRGFGLPEREEAEPTGVPVLRRRRRRSRKSAEA
jgi:polyphosphate kinase